MCGSEDSVLPPTAIDEQRELFYRRHRDCPKANVRSQVARRLFYELEAKNYQQRRAEKDRQALVAAEKELETNEADSTHDFCHRKRTYEEDS